MSQCLVLSLVLLEYCAALLDGTARNFSERFAKVSRTTEKGLALFSLLIFIPHKIRKVEGNKTNKQQKNDSCRIID
jgi:hypothetical protein